MSKRAIVLGGAGLIGSHLSVRLLKDGYDVVVIDKRGRRESPILRSIENRDRFHYIKHDITIPYEIGCDELYNLTSPIEFGNEFDYIDQMKLTSMGIINSLNNTIGNDTKVLYASSDDVYNFDRLDVEYQSDRFFLAEAKRFGESLHRAHQAHYNIDLRVARIFSTYGANSGLRDQHVIGKMIVEALHNHDIAIYGNGEQVRTFCWVEDIVDGLIRMMRTHTHERIIIADLGSPNQITIRELAEMIITLTGSKSNIYHISARADEPRYKIPHLKTAQNELKWEASTPLKEGLLRTINYIEKELSLIAINQMSWIEIYG
ncbi:MAG: NAD-dependent epimerase/dehydratase family protein [Rikenellaceae bacterium]